MKSASDSYELHTLLHQAELLIEANQVTEALKLYDLIIEQDSTAIYILQRRGLMRRLTGDFNGAISDYNQAIEMSPDDAGLYCERGACLAHQLSHITSIDRYTKTASLERIIADYNASVERDPSNDSAWLAIVETRLLQHDWDTAISSYALCRPYIRSDQYLLVRAWLGCLALCLAGDKIEAEDSAPLDDMRIKLHTTSWCVPEVDRLLDELQNDGNSIPTLDCAMKIQHRFLDHFSEKPILCIK